MPILKTKLALLAFIYFCQSALSRTVFKRGSIVTACSKKGWNRTDLSLSASACPCSLYAKFSKHSETVQNVSISLRSKQHPNSKTKQQERIVLKKGSDTFAALNNARYVSKGEYFPSIEVFSGANEGCVDIEYFVVPTDSIVCPVQLSDRSQIENKIDNGQEINDQALIDFTAYIHTPFFGSCSGTLIGKRYVLTAAHCEPSSRTIVQIGGHRPGQGTTHNVRKVSIHPDYYSWIGSAPDEAALRHDLAVLEIFPESNNNFAYLNGDESVPNDLSFAKALGYGVDTKNFAQSDILSFVDIKIRNHEWCKSSWRNLLGLSDKEHICAGAYEDCNGGVCRGMLCLPYWSSLFLTRIFCCR